MYDRVTHINPAHAAAAAEKAAQMGATCIGPGNPSQIRQPTVAEEIINRLEQVNSILREAADTQVSLISRLHGEGSQDTGQNSAGRPVPSGALGSIEERIQWLTANAAEILNNARRLSSLA